jgi:hypothetical protein
MRSCIASTRSSLLPSARNPASWPGYHALDTGDATVETIRIFHDKTSADRSNELAADYVRENLDEFELTRTAVSGGEVLVSRMTPEALGDAHRWRTGVARLRSS